MPCWGRCVWEGWCVFVCVRCGGGGGGREWRGEGGGSGRDTCRFVCAAVFCTAFSCACCSWGPSRGQWCKPTAHGMRRGRSSKTSRCTWLSYGPLPCAAAIPDGSQCRPGWWCAGRGSRRGGPAGPAGLGPGICHPAGCGHLPRPRAMRGGGGSGRGHASRRRGGAADARSVLKERVLPPL